MCRKLAPTVPGAYSGHTPGILFLQPRWAQALTGLTKMAELYGVEVSGTGEAPDTEVVASVSVADWHALTPRGAARETPAAVVPLWPSRSAPSEP